MENDTKKQIAKLTAENLKLKAELATIKSGKKVKRSFNKWFKQATSNAFVGKGLKKSLFNLYNELPGPVAKDTMADVSSHLIWRMTRIGSFAIMVAVIPFLVMVIQTFILDIQNEKLDKQNMLLMNQNHRLDQQVHLEEGMRRSSFVFLMSNIIDKMDEELKTPENMDRQLSKELIGRIVSLTQALRPYRYLENDSLTTRMLSPERGQLLYSLVNSELSETTYDQIFKRAIFSYSDLRDANFEGAYLEKANLANSYFSNANFTDADLTGVNLSNSYLENALFLDTEMDSIHLKKTNLKWAQFYFANLQDAQLQGADLREVIIHKTDFNYSNLEGFCIHNAEVDSVNLEGAYFETLGAIDSILNSNVIGLKSVQDEYEIIEVIRQGSMGKIDTLFVLEIEQGNRE